MLTVAPNLKKLKAEHQSTQNLRMCFIALLAVAGSCSLPLAAQEHPTRSLTIEASRVVDGSVVVTLRNIDNRAISAWGVQGVATFKGGGKKSIDMTIDGCVTGFRNAAGAASMLLPGATYTSRGGGLQLKEPVAALSLTPSIVVFEDGSATGDEAKIESLFLLRARDRRAYRTIELALARQLGADDPLASVTAFERALEAGADDESHSSPLYINVRGNLRLAVKAASDRRLDLAARLREMWQEATANRSSADKHYRRR